MGSEDFRARRWLTIIGTPLLAFIVLAAWAFASPVGSSPDDDFHLPSIWCGIGERPGLCETVDDSAARLVPIPIVNSTCYAFHPEEDAGCWDPSLEGLTKVERANVDGLYPRLYYTVMSVFASPDIQLSVIMIRLANSAFAVGLLTALILALPRRIRPAVVVSVLATAVPLGVFIYASTNPSSWALLSATTVWAALFGATQTSGRRRWVLAVLALFGAVIGAGARADAAIFAVYGTAMALLLGLRSLRNLRDQLIPLVTAALIIVTSAGFYASARQGGAAFGGLDPAAGRLTLAQHVSNFLEVPSLWIGALGQSNLGWFDTRMPSVVWVLTTAVFGGVLFVGLKGGWRRRTLAIVLALVAMWIVPFVMLAQSNAVVGATVQPRYLLPLLIIAVGVSSLRADAEEAWGGARFWLAAASLWVALTIALHQNIARYTSGSEGDSVDPGAGGEWWWDGVPSPMVTWVAGSLAFAGMLVGLWLLKKRTSRRVEATPFADGDADPAVAGTPTVTG
ncbi:DUF2142 domain-containing protein [Microbacterium cremeum]|uniref:DUF2142 domain-containing protein n=1 Tax=Microbacterium cremeum TaxID=2782169 RepID=UPI0018883C3A|nr:DUF2142 domain-containing protein [Microbacterium cremeum]